MRDPRCLALGLLSAAFLAMGSAVAWADDGSIVLDFVGYGELGDMTVVNTLVPGPNLTDTGEQQAQASLMRCRATVSTTSTPRR
jgi:hypothetical protein